MTKKDSSNLVVKEPSKNNKTKNKVKKNNTSNKKNIEEKNNATKKKFMSLFESYEEPETKKNKQLKQIVEIEENKTFDTKNIIISFIVGLVIGLIIMLLFIPDRIAKLQNGEEAIVQIGDKYITADKLYNEMKNNYAINFLIQNIDNIILSDLYPENNEMKTTVNNTADYYISMYETLYGYGEDQFLSSNGFATRADFINQLELDYRRNKYFTEYVKKMITDNDIENYYTNNVFGPISTKYISIESDKDNAEQIMNDILNRLKTGDELNNIIKDYKGYIKYEDLGYVEFDSDISDIYINTLQKLDNNTYTQEVITDDNTYKIIFREEQNEKQGLEEIKERVINALINKKENEDKTLYYKALYAMRIENKMEIKDTELANKYNQYIKEVTSDDNNQ